MVKYFSVHPALQQYIDYIAYTHFDFSGVNALSRLYTFVPNHTRFITFYLADFVKVKKFNGDFVSRGRSIVIGPQITPVTLDLGVHHRSFVIAFKPGCMHRLIKVPLMELVDLDFNADEIIGPEVKRLMSRLEEEIDVYTQFTLIQQFFYNQLSKLKPVLPFDYAIQELVNSCGNLPIDFVARQSCLSVRQFERYALERIGVPPKAFARLIRFSNAYMLKEFSPDLTWSAIAYKCGYFDQMHFIRDFKKIAGFLPKSLMKEDIENSVRFQKLSFLGDLHNERSYD